MKEIVRPDGTLDDRRIWRRDILYTGTNGKCVERVYVSPDESYIFKPLTNESQLGQEAWVYEHILKGMSFPAVYPQLLAGSELATSEHSWQLFEDLGPLEHNFEAEAALELVAHVAWWHALPVEHLQQQQLLGPKPFIEDIAKQVMDLSHRNELLEPLATRFTNAESVLEHLESLMMQPAATATQHWSRNVISHGDLHLGNYARVKGAVSVLDWEHAHLNSRYWDLFHLIDSTHPVFPKAMTSELREELLNRYILQSASHGIELEASAFKQGYYLFTALFSLWMVLLIAGDLRRLNGVDGKWSIQQLQEQLKETLDNLEQCVNRLAAQS
ncbi:phosphotransferase [Paenibacillus sp. CF384]|uniref:phosphotransferase n=1 Tax=Paenibacillus sp. CF384 TaxID=1884382 RepID=UPI00089598F9|nr:phosphotransferase [Paenibacillus sp. CF384]SDX31954.1 Predicted kinase, aminoglycoside phosphotransferase (APT) family [Paenibacillus sp. CF384]